MTIRYIIRPRKIYSTPKRLKDALFARRTVAYPFVGNRRPSLLRDFFLAYPPEDELEDYEQILLATPGTRSAYRRSGLRSVEQPLHIGCSDQPDQRILSPLDRYRVARQFATANKPAQRALLESPSGGSFPVPPTATTREGAQSLRGISRDLQFPSTKFIVRPLRHTMGQGWRLTEDPTDFIEGQEYIQAVYPKNHEYRVIAVRGVPIITLLKRVPEDLPRSQPWNHANGSSFVTVNDPDSNRLRYCDILDRIQSSPLMQSIDLAGIDIMYRREGEYAVTEVNLCPALTIEDNIQKVARHIGGLYAQ